MKKHISPIHHIISAKEARAKLDELNSPDKIKARNEMRICQELNRIHEEIQDAISRSDSDVLIYIHKTPEIVEPIKDILKERGYIINDTALDIDPRDSFRISW